MRKIFSIVTGVIAVLSWCIGLGSFFYYLNIYKKAPRIPHDDYLVSMNNHGAIFYMTVHQAYLFHAMFIGGILFFVVFGGINTWLRKRLTGRAHDARR